MLTGKQLKEISKTFSYYLRHAPWEAELIADTAGWVPVEDLILALNDSYAGLVTLESVKYMITQAAADGDKDRFELSEDEVLIRARYGHSYAVVPPEEPALEVPHILYHGTTVEAAAKIKSSAAIKPMSRTFVHWSAHADLAKKIAMRHRGKKHTMFFLDAQAAHAEGLEFYDCKNGIWLSPEVPVKFTTQGPTF